MSDAKLLIIDDDPAMLRLAQVNLKQQGYETFTAESGEQALAMMAETRFALALTDLKLPDIDGVDLVKRIKEVAPDIEIIMVTGYASVSAAVDATKAGAFYFVEKPVDFDKLQLLIEKALERRRQTLEIQQLYDRLARSDSYYNIIGRSKGMLTVFEMIEGIAESDANVLIIGESGTGKELVASAIHYRSHRAKRPFKQVNCAALPKELIESELFGHTKGAFTGATFDKVGLIGATAGGSLLLDEIGEMPLELQPKLLRVLQERIYYRVGSEKPHEADFRLIAATNRNPLDAVREGQLREDLYYRLNTIEIHVPPLREREEDVQALAEHFLRTYAARYNRPAVSISHQAYERLFNHNWPGNVRELQNVIERAVLLCKGETVGIEHLPFASSWASATNTDVSEQHHTPAVPETTKPARSAISPEPGGERHNNYSIEELCQMIVGRIAEPRPNAPMNELFKQLEVYLARAAVERTRGNKQAAANLLGIYRPRLYSLLRKEGAQNGMANRDSYRAGEGA